ncbi:hypothetical protein SCH01S_09_00240 [Sphingomonas changbaiensis NBRC 104936]|uniref:Uncharacterized protein n=1 Tax=Sphingomonas changbaiensis NBRC 104936 TaxID=1219043 RepID=A0A0E9MK42_9SPHN|nr:hypothetical protein SCH01S_09_00240 [Sphingomonas changbaiensis NBRC 104936]
MQNSLSRERERATRAGGRERGEGTVVKVIGPSPSHRFAAGPSLSRKRERG